MRPSTHLDSGPSSLKLGNGSSSNIVNTNGGLSHPSRNFKSIKPGSKSLSLLTQQLKIGYQRVNIDVDLSQNKIEGLTELTIFPLSSSLKSIKLDCREMKIKNVFINNSKTTNFIHKDILYINNDKFFDESVEEQSINLFDLYAEDINIHQHHLIRQKLNYIFGESNYDPRDPNQDYSNGNTEELTIILPDNLKFELTDINAINTPGSHAATVTPLHLKSKATASNEIYTPIYVKIEYETINCKNGVNFVTDDADKKYWHAYTTNSDYNISTSSWVPCIDNLWDRCTWSIEINVPRAMKDIGNPRVIGKDNKRKRKLGDMELDTDHEEDDDDEVESHDLVVCSGDFNNVKETPHPTDMSKKVVSWSIFNPVCAHHVGWALGCFESIVLLDTTEDMEVEDKDEIPFDADMEKDNSKSPVTIYCFPDQLELARNTCIFTNNAIDFYLKEFGSYPFSSYAIVFVHNSQADSNTFAGLSIVRDTLLYPTDIIEPIFTSTEVLLESVAYQWSGINIAAQTFNDLWVTIGIARYMSLEYLRKLMGLNEYRFKIRKMIDQIVEEDYGKKPLALQFYRFPISECDLAFIRLKAPIVLYILNKRMTKTDKSFGLSRVIPKLFLQAMSGDLQNGTLSTQHFQYVCEKVNRNKLESFFKQWVYGVGAPVFYITQRFNKKRGLIEMNIRQTQVQQAKKVRPQPKNFLNDSIAYLDDEPTFPIQPVFTGPMTIRVHELDGTPYEHIVDLKEGHTKLDIQYNAKFKRLKKLKEDMDESIATFNKLGDVLESPSEMEEWALSEFDKPEDELLFNDAFEWIRVDVDFEWIAKIEVKQPDYMYGSQLLYDRDVEAQYEAVKYFGEIEKPAVVHCTVLTRTIMDPRYYYGVRIAAAEALANFSKQGNHFIGVGYLIKAFKELFCFPGSSIPLSNDFNDFGKYFLQKEIPRILSNIKDDEGEVPFVIKNLILNLIKFNDNSNNNFQDGYYLSYLLTSLINCATHGSSIVSVNDLIKLSKNPEEGGTPEKRLFIVNVINEIERLQKMDEWVPSYQSLIAVTCIRQKIRLASHGLLKISFEELLYLTLDKYSYDVRVDAFKGLFVLGALKNSSILKYFLKTSLLESTPYFRTKLLDAFVESICIAAIQGTPSTLDDPEFKTLDKLLDTKQSNDNTNMVIIEDGSNSEMDAKRDVFARATLNGAIQLLRRDYSVGKGLKHALWELLHSSLLSIYEKRNIFTVCQVLYRQMDKFLVRIPVPSVPISELNRKIVLKNMGGGIVVIKREGRFKIQLASRKLVVAPETRATRDERRTAFKTSKPTAVAPVVTFAPKEPIVVPDVVIPKPISLRESRRASVASKRIKREAVQVAPPSLVTINKSQVKFKFNTRTLPKLAKEPVDITAMTVPMTASVTDANVRVAGSEVTFLFGESHKVKFKETVSTPGDQKSRFIRIHTKEKRISVSPVPFAETVSVKAEPLEALDEVQEGTPALSPEVIETESASKKITPEPSQKQGTLDPLLEQPTPESRTKTPEVANSKKKKPSTPEIANSKKKKPSTPDLANSKKKKSGGSTPSQQVKVEPTDPKLAKKTTPSKSPTPLQQFTLKKSSLSRGALAEPELSVPPFSKSSSPFSSGSGSAVKKRKTKIYIHSESAVNPSSKSSSPENNNSPEKEKSPEIISKPKEPVPKAEKPEPKPKAKTGFKLKLNLKKQ